MDPNLLISMSTVQMKSLYHTQAVLLKDVRELKENVSAMMGLLQDIENHMKRQKMTSSELKGTEPFQREQKVKAISAATRTVGKFSQKAHVDSQPEGTVDNVRKRKRAVVETTYNMDAILIRNYFVANRESMWKCLKSIYPVVNNDIPRDFLLVQLRGWPLWPARVMVNFDEPLVPLDVSRRFPGKIPAPCQLHTSENNEFHHVLVKFFNALPEHAFAFVNLKTRGKQIRPYDAKLVRNSKNKSVAAAFREAEIAINRRKTKKLHDTASQSQFPPSQSGFQADLE